MSVKHKKMFFIILGIILIILTIVICRFLTKKNSVHLEVLLDELGDRDFNEYIFYESVGDIGGKCQVVKSNKNSAVLDKGKKFISTCFNVYDSSVLTRIEENSKLTKEEMLDYGQVFLYDKNEKYEVIVLDSYNNKYWKVISLDVDSLQVGTVELQKEYFSTKDVLASMQLDENILYLYAKDENNITAIEIDISEVDIGNHIKSYQISKEDIEYYDRELKYSCIFIHNKYAYIWDGDKDEHDTVEGYEKDKGKSFLIKYNLETKEVKSANLDGLLWRLTYTEDGIIGLRTEFDQLYLDRFSDDLKLMSTTNLELERYEEFTPQFGVMDEYFYYNDGLLYGTVTDKKKRNAVYSLIIDLEKSKIIYYAKISGTKAEYGKIFNWYCDSNDEELYSIY
jgi:hypothetical protein